MLINYLKKILSRIINLLEQCVLNSGADESALNYYCQRLEKAYEINECLKNPSKISVHTLSEIDKIVDFLSPAEKDSVFVLDDINQNLLRKLHLAASNTGNKDLAQEAEGFLSFLELNPPVSIDEKDKDVLYRTFDISSDSEIKELALYERDNLIPENNYVKVYFYSLGKFGHYLVTISEKEV